MMANGNFAGGDGKETNPYLIEDVDDLDAIRNNLSSHYKLINNIDLTGYQWVPIGDYEDSSTPSITNPFKGTFDGDGKTISGLNINTNYSHVGLFATVGEKGVVKNVIAKDFNITYGSGTSSKNRRGCIAGAIANEAVIENCIAINFIIGGRYHLGGIVGSIQSSNNIIKNCYAMGGEFVKLVSGSAYGIVDNLGNNKSSVQNCYSIGTNADYGITKPNLSSNSFYDKEVSNITNETNEGLITSKMKDNQTFIDAGWSEGVWKFHYRSEDYPRLWFQPNWYDIKSFLKAGDVMYSLDTDGHLLLPQVSIVPTRQEFEDYGMDDLTGMFAPMNIVQYTMTEIRELSKGMTFTQKITPADFSRQIKRIRNARE